MYITAAFIKGKVKTTCKHKVMKLPGVQALKLNTMFGPKRGSHMVMHNSSSVQGGWWTECIAYVWGVGITHKILAGKSKRK